jgi:hypothetical protein
LFFHEIQGHHAKSIRLARDRPRPSCPSFASNQTEEPGLENTMSIHNRVVELHNLAAHAHQNAAAAHEKGDHLSAHELTQKAVEHSAEAHRLSKELTKQEQATGNDA